MRPYLAELSGRDGPGAITYQLRRLRLHGMIERLPNSYSYRVTQTGFRAALFFSRTYNRLLRPGLAAVLPRSPGPSHTSKRTSPPLSPNSPWRRKLDTFTPSVRTQAELGHRGLRVGPTKHSALACTRCAGLMMIDDRVGKPLQQVGAADNTREPGIAEHGRA